MLDISTPILITILVALLITLFLIYLGRGGKLKSLKLDMFRGLFKLDGSLDTTNSNDQIIPEYKTKETNTNAYKLLKWIQDKEPLNIEGHYVITQNTLDNGKIAALLYSRLEGHVIGTCFFENPFYGRADFAKNISKGTYFFRLTNEENCDQVTKQKVKEMFSESDISCSAKLSIIPHYENYSKIGGIFAQLNDGSFLAFLSLNDGKDKSANRGLVFTGTLARELYLYYEYYANKYLI